jgi:hypothetical protein
MFQMVNQHQAHAEMILELYLSKKITLAMLAELGGHSVIHTWEMLQAGGETRIVASGGNAEEIQREVSLIIRAEVLLVELTGLLTIASLDLLPALKKRFDRIIAPQFLMDQITDELTLERAGLRSQLASGALYREGARYVIQQGPRVKTEERAHFLQKLLEVLTHEVRLLPTPDILEFSQRETNPFGRAALASILLAKESGALLYSDDYVLRTVAKNSWDVASVWSQPVLRDLTQEMKISEDEYHRCIISLVQRNYHFVGVNWHDYISLLSKTGQGCADFC